MQKEMGPSVDVNFAVATIPGPVGDVPVHQCFLLGQVRRTIPPSRLPSPVLNSSCLRPLAYTKNNDEKNTREIAHAQLLGLFAPSRTSAPFPSSARLRFGKIPPMVCI